MMMLIQNETPLITLTHTHTHIYIYTYSSTNASLCENVDHLSLSTFSGSYQMHRHTTRVRVRRLARGGQSYLEQTLRIRRGRHFEEGFHEFSQFRIEVDEPNSFNIHN